MFLVFTLVLLVVAVGILASVYSIFFPFMQNLGTVNQYQMAYYGAISAVERAELGLRYRDPGFVGSGGFLGATGYGPLSDYTPELSSGVQQGFRRTKDSRTTSIPHIGMGNTDPMLSDSSSKDYNTLGYSSLETFLLSYDATSASDFYSSGTATIQSFSGASITGVFRLPPKIFSGFGGGNAALLCDRNFVDSACDPNDDGIYDDVILSWSMEGFYNGNGFKIFPTTSVFYYSGMQIDEPMDNTIRESIINEKSNINFTTSFTPVAPHGKDLLKHNVVGQNDPNDYNFNAILADTNAHFSGLRISFGAVSLFRSFTGSVYPYLEYQFTFPQPIADRFYTIQGHGRVGEYDVQIILKKPTVQGTVGGDFTVIF